MSWFYETQQVFTECLLCCQPLGLAPLGYRSNDTTRSLCLLGSHGLFREARCRWKTAHTGQQRPLTPPAPSLGFFRHCRCLLPGFRRPRPWAPTSPPRLTVHEGQELALGCLADEHASTHTWPCPLGGLCPSACGTATLQEVVGLRPDLAVDAGAPYAARLASGSCGWAREGVSGTAWCWRCPSGPDARHLPLHCLQWIQDPGMAAGPR